MSQSMPIPWNKVNLSERDIENYLYNNPQVVRFVHLHVSRWTGRQVSVPSGIVDLIGIVSNGEQEQGVAVVEIKNVDIDTSALTQVSRYASDIQNMLTIADIPFIPVYKIIIAPHISDQRYCEAMALSTFIITFKTTVSASFSDVGWTHDYLTRRQEQYETMLSQNSSIADLVETFGSFIDSEDDQDYQEDEVISDAVGKA